MLRIGICDDQIEARDALRFQLEKVLWEGSEQIIYIGDLVNLTCSLVFFWLYYGSAVREADSKSLPWG